MRSPIVTRTLLGLAALTLAAGAAFPAPPAPRAEALAALQPSITERRAEAVVWVANHGRMDDTQLLLKRLQRDESPFVRGYAEQGLWLLWSRSGDAAIDRAMARATDDMQAGRHAEALAGFSDVIRSRPDFAEGWNKRATVYYLAREYQKSLADCDEVIKRNPAHFGALAGYGQIYLQLDDPERALEYFRRALVVNPNMESVEAAVKVLEHALAQRKKTI